MANSYFPLLLRQRAAGLLCGLVLLTAYGLALAQTPAPDAAPAESANGAALTKGEIKARRDFQLLDFNKDGKLSRSEVALFPRLAAAFDTADTDKDGFVSFEEVEVFALQYRAERAAKAAQQADKK
ncbi:MAG: EF-hand domain-containing protein [Comamonas sp.]|uniref:EF-hand domain-containing protein n=1 Tax=Comamonas sp. TaxID=34028 RepID=UPI002FCA514F